MSSTSLSYPEDKGLGILVEKLSKQEVSKWFEMEGMIGGWRVWDCSSENIRLVYFCLI